MSEPQDQVRISEEPGGFGREIEARLLLSLREASTQAENRNLVLSARDPEGDIVGGLVASTSYGWLLVKALWVAEDHRGGGVGRRLMQHAEEKARAISCHAVWLDTSSPDARQFYEKLGFEAFGRLENDKGQHPEDHRRWFMQKMILPEETSSSPMTP